MAKKTATKEKAKSKAATKLVVKPEEQVKLEEELLAQAGVQTIDEGTQETLDSKQIDETQELNANGAIQAPKPEDGANIKEEVKEPVTMPETHLDGEIDYFIATHTIKANGMYYDVGDKVPKV